MSHTKQVLKKATFAMGCFWGPEGFFGCVPGVVRTRVGYCGGTTLNPTYHNLGDYTETIDIDYDPSATTYDNLLRVFWLNHDPTVRQKVQYMSAIYYHDDQQKKLAEETKNLEEKKLGTTVLTKILPFVTFYDAESYHQKYLLRTFHPVLYSSLNLTEKDLSTSTIATKLSGYVTGNGTLEAFNKECDSFGLSPENVEYVKEQIKSPNRGVC